MPYASVKNFEFAAKGLAILVLPFPKALSTDYNRFPVHVSSLCQISSNPAIRQSGNPQSGNPAIRNL